MSTTESRYEWAVKQRERLCPVGNPFAVQTIDACVNAFSAGGKDAAAAEFKKRMNTKSGKEVPLWAAAALKDIICGLIRAY